jgi:hypothetical protein
MKYIKSYQIFEASASALTAEQIEWLDEYVNGSWKLNPSTGLVDVDGDFYCRGQGLTDFKGVKLRKVSKDFDCGYNQLTTLVGAPQSVGGNFYCENNQLTTLVGAPNTVGGFFGCANNPVSSGTLKALFDLMKRGNSYQKALEEYWPEMEDKDKMLMYKDHPSLTPEETRKYKALATYSNIKGYL